MNVDLARIRANSDLAGADHSNASLPGCDLSKAVLCGANLTGADLRNANLSNANLDSADLSRANLMGANLSGARLQLAKLRRTKLVGATVDPGALERADVFGAALPWGQGIVPVTGDFLQNVTSVAWGDDDDLIFAGELFGLLSVWDVTSCSRIRSIHTGSRVGSLAWSPKNRVLASGTADGSITVWNASALSLLRTIPAHQGSINKLAFAPNEKFLASAADDGTISFWDTISGERSHTFGSSGAAIQSIAFSLNGQYLASCSKGGAVNRYDVAGRRMAGAMNSGGKCLHAVAFDPRGGVMASGGCDGPVELWDVETGALIRALRLGPALSLAYSPDGKILAVGGERSFSLWNTADWTRMQGHDLAMLCVHDLAFDKSGCRLAHGCAAGAGGVTDIKAGRRLFTLSEQAGLFAQDLAVDSQNGSLAIVTSRGMASFWDFGQRRETRRLMLSRRLVAAALSPNGKFLVDGDSNADLCLWDCSSGACLWTRQLRPTCTAFDPASRLIAFGAGIDVHVVDVERGRAFHQFRPDRKYRILLTAFDPKSQFLAGAGYGGRVVIWDLARGTQCRCWQAHSTGSVGALAFAPDGNVLATGGEGGDLKLWDFRERKCVRTIDAHANSVMHLVISGCGRFLASAGSDFRVKLWDLSNGSLLHAFPTNHLADALAFGPGAQWLIALLRDGAAIWRTSDGQLETHLLPLDEGWIACQPNGSCRSSGNVPSTHFWLASGLCRFEVSELAQFLPEIRIEDSSAPALQA